MLGRTFLSSSIFALVLGLAAKAEGAQSRAYSSGRSSFRGGRMNPGRIAAVPSLSMTIGAKGSLMRILSADQLGSRSGAAARGGEFGWMEAFSALSPALPSASALQGSIGSPAQAPALDRPFSPDAGALGVSEAGRTALDSRLVVLRENLSQPLAAAGRLAQVGDGAASDLGRQIQDTLMERASLSGGRQAVLAAFGLGQGSWLSPGPASERSEGEGLNEPAQAAVGRARRGELHSGQADDPRLRISRLSGVRAAGHPLSPQASLIRKIPLLLLIGDRLFLLPVYVDASLRQAAQQAARVAAREISSISRRPFTALAGPVVSRTASWDEMLGLSEREAHSYREYLGSALADAPKPPALSQDRSLESGVLPYPARSASVDFSMVLAVLLLAASALLSRRILR
ncbi:MAG: hypothetical protein HY549_09580 [Elusimicrobia bacterium]|nr:hypothetical protein [Elusimicrobiota bacterium]